MGIYHVYAIRSSKDDRIYVGMSQQPHKRLLEHNAGEVRSTRPYRPWQLIYSKEVGTRIEARQEEKRLKSGYGKEFLKKI